MFCVWIDGLYVSFRDILNSFCNNDLQRHKQYIETKMLLDKKCRYCVFWDLRGRTYMFIWKRGILEGVFFPPEFS
jgi:hypothetical protein